MKTLIIEGGFPMWFVLALGLVALAGAVAFAARPAAARERFVTRMSMSTLCATLVALASDLGATFHYVGEQEMALDRRIQMTMVGIGESMAPLIMGFGFLTLIALLVAVGRARFDAKNAD
jgi:hypothetical protein